MRVRLIGVSFRPIELEYIQCYPMRVLRPNPPGIDPCVLIRRIQMPPHCTRSLWQNRAHRQNDHVSLPCHLGSGRALPVLLDAADLNQELWRIQHGVRSQVLYAFSHASELC